MRGVLAIARKELGSAFGRPTAYAVLALFVLLFSLLTLWFDDVLLGGVASLRRPFFWAGTCLLVGVPALTMRTLAEEQRTGSWMLLGTLPVSTLEVVVGKWLGAVALVAVALALTLPWPVALAWLGDPDPGPILGGYLGLLLGGAALAAVGVAASAASESQVVAFLVALGLGVVPWLVGNALPLVPAEHVSWVRWLTFDFHFENLARGVLDTRSVVVAATTTAVALRLAVHALELRRLR